MSKFKIIYMDNKDRVTIYVNAFIYVINDRTVSFFNSGGDMEMGFIASSYTNVISVEKQ